MMKVAQRTIACAILSIISAAANGQEVTNQSSVAQGICTGNRNYWYQGMKLKDGSLCTKYSFNQFFSVPILWDPKWNAEAKKHYCRGSEKDSCFMK